MLNPSASPPKGPPTDSGNEILRPFRNIGGGIQIKEEASYSTFGFAAPKISHSGQKEQYELIGNKENLEIITKWIGDKLSNKETYPYVLLVGSVGVGKSEFLRKCFVDSKCSVVEYDDELRGDTYDILKNSINMTNIEFLFSTSKKQLGVIIDNYQTTLIPAHRKEFITYLRENKTCPVIFTSNTMSNTTDLQRGKGLVLRFEPPTVGQMVGLARKLAPVLRREEMSDEDLVRMAEATCPDIRSFRNLLESKVTQFKDPNMDIYDNIEYFFKNNFRDSLRQTSLFTSHIVQENYLSMVPNGVGMGEIWEMAEYCSIGDLVKESAFQNQAWDYMNDIGNALGTLGPMTTLKNLGATASNTVAKVPNRKSTSMPLHVSELRLSLIDVYYIFQNIVGNSERIENDIESFFEFTKGMEFENSLKILHLVYSFNNVPYKDVKRITSKLKKYYEANYSET